MGVRRHGAGARQVGIFCIQNQLVNPGFCEAPYDRSFRGFACTRHFLHTKFSKASQNMADVIPIRGSTVLHEQVARKLRAMLVEGRIAAGANLNERVLS